MSLVCPLPRTVRIAALLAISAFAGCHEPCGSGYGWTEGGYCLPLDDGESAPPCDTGAGRDTADPADSGMDTGHDTGTPVDDPWDGEDYWLGSTIFDVILDLDQAPAETSYWAVQMSVSEDWWGTNPEYTTVAHSFSSLDLLVVDNGLVLLGGVDFKSLDLGEEGEAYRWGYLYALTTPDLENWGTRIWPVEDAVSARMTDPALQQMPDGTVRAVYYSTPPDTDMDPADIAGTHDIRMATWEPEREAFVEWPDPIYWDEWLVDPVVRALDGTHHFFATRNGVITHATSESGYAFDREDDFEWTEVQVPFALEHDGELLVAAQGGGGNGPPWYRYLDTAGEWTEPTLFYEDYEWYGGSCTSPVLGRYDGLYVLFCAVYIDPNNP